MDIQKASLRKVDMSGKSVIEKDRGIRTGLFSTKQFFAQGGKV